MLQSQELRRGGWVNEGVAPLIRQGLLSVLEAARERKSVGVGVCLCVYTRTCVCQGKVASPLGRKLWFHLISGSVLSIRGCPSVLPPPLRVPTEAFALALALNSQSLSDASRPPSPKIQAPPFFPYTLSTLSYVGPSSSPPDPQPHHFLPSSHLTLSHSASSTPPALPNRTQLPHRPWSPETHLPHSHTNLPPLS